MIFSPRRRANFLQEAWMKNEARATSVLSQENIAATRRRGVTLLILIFR